MTKSRLEAFSDGVLAIVITIMVLELQAPREATFGGLVPLLPVILSYALSFLFVGIYWNNHHHLFQAAQQVNGRVLWANLHLLFWLSLIPFATTWVGRSGFAAAAVALYGILLLMSAAAYYLLTRALLALHGSDSQLAGALGSDFKGKVSLVIFAIAIPLAFSMPWLAGLIYLGVAGLWLIPDQRFEKLFQREPDG
jgi:uncharacterized membrane protein